WMHPVQRDQRGLRTTVIFLARECCMSGWKQLQGLLSRTFLVLAGQFPEPFPSWRLDDFDRDRAQCDCCFDGADGASVFETRRCALLRHRLRAFNESAEWFVLIDEIADSGDIDTFFCAGTNDRNIDAFNQYRNGLVGNLDDSQSAANTRIDAKYFCHDQHSPETRRRLQFISQQKIERGSEWARGATT